MIVDLLRNDMNRISEIGSEHVTHLCQVEQYSTVWQMTSTIESRLRAEIDLIQTFRALFPCGSITGAPKMLHYGNHPKDGEVSVEVSTVERSASFFQKGNGFLM